MKANSIFKRLLWILYAVAAGSGFLTAMLAVGASLGCGEPLVLVAAAVLFCMAGLIVISLKKVWQGRRPAGAGGKKTAAVIAESAVFILCLIGMAALRIPAVFYAQANPYYEAAAVTAGQRLALTGHGGEDLYLLLLHGVLLLLGNRVIWAAALQVALQVIAAVFFYRAVRRFSGSVSAVISLAFFAFSPYLSQEFMELSPLALVLAVYGLALCVISCIWGQWNRDGGNGHPAEALLLYLFAGILAGLCCGLDVSGISILICLFWRILFYRKPGEQGGVKAPKGFWNNRVFACSFCLLAAALGFMGVQAFAGLMSDSGPAYVMGLWAQKFASMSFRVPAAVNGQSAVWDVLLLMYLLVIGIFSFFRGRMLKSCGVWLAAAAVLIGLQCFGAVHQEPVDSFALLYLFCAAAAGNAVGVIFAGDETKYAAVPEKEDKAVPEENVNGDAPPEDKAERAEDTAEKEASRKAEDEIELIYNPLPLPKKSEKKVMDFDYEVAEDDDFDIS